MWTQNGTTLTLPPWFFDTNSTTITLTSTGTNLHWDPLPLDIDMLYSVSPPPPKPSRELKPGWECAKERARVKALKMKARTPARPTTTKRWNQGGPFGKRK